MEKSFRQYGVLLTIIAITSIWLVGCGGSGGSGSGNNSGYEGNTEAAVISDENAAELAIATYDSSALEGPFGEIASLAQSSSPAVNLQGKPLLLGVSDVLQTALFKADPAAATSTAARAAVTIEESITGSCGGSASFSIQADDSSGVFSGSFSFSSFCEDDISLQGQASFSGRVDPETEALESFTFTFTGLSGTSNSESFRLNGELSITTLGNPCEVTLDLLYEDLAADETFWLDDFTIRVTEAVGYDDVTISGRVYHPVHGYVDFETTTAFRVYSSDDYPSQGALVLTGADNAKARMTVLSNTQYQVEADLDGDNVYDWGPEAYNWDE